MNSSPRDSISSLPDEILGKILSLLPTKLAASTSILSKRWKNLLGLVDSLCFDDSMVLYPNEEEATSGSHRFLDFVDKTVALLSNSPIIKKFSLSRGHIYGRGCDAHSEYARVNLCVNRWIRTAMERGLLELHLHANPFSGVDVETELLTSKTLVKLTLSGEYFLQAKRMFFPALKSLSLLSVSGLDYPNQCRLIHGCPVLEDLFIHDADPLNPSSCGGAVESESIKRLVVFVNLKKHDQPEITYLAAPNLVYLDYSSYVCENYQFVDLDSLDQVRLSLRLWESTYDYDYDDDEADDNDDDEADDNDDDEADDNDDDEADDNDNDDDEADDNDDDEADNNDEPEAAIFGDVSNLVAGISNITTLHLSPDSLEVLHFCCGSMPMFNNLLNLSIESNKEKGWQVMSLLLKLSESTHFIHQGSCAQNNK